jgi:DNA modification methylase
MEPMIEVAGARVFLGDCRDVLRTLPDNSVDSIVTDPPYELGFMGKKWDSSGIAYDVTVWQECLRVLKPGGHVLAFGGSRTWHRLAVAVEDAGFELRDSIAWIYGSGFPEVVDVSKAIDKRLGADGTTDEVLRMAQGNARKTAELGRLEHSLIQANECP